MIISPFPWYGAFWQGPQFSAMANRSSLDCLIDPPCSGDPPLIFPLRFSITLRIPDVLSPGWFKGFRASPSFVLFPFVHFSSQSSGGRMLILSHHSLDGTLPLPEYFFDYSFVPFRLVFLLIGVLVSSFLGRLFFWRFELVRDGLVFISR